MVHGGAEPILPQSLVCFAGKHLEALDGHWAFGEAPVAGENPLSLGEMDGKLINDVWGMLGDM